MAVCDQYVRQAETQRLALLIAQALTGPPLAEAEHDRHLQADIEKLRAAGWLPDDDMTDAEIIEWAGLA
jgi:hypothetical protein